MKREKGEGKEVDFQMLLKAHQSESVNQKEREKRKRETEREELKGDRQRQKYRQTGK